MPSRTQPSKFGACTAGWLFALLLLVVPSSPALAQTEPADKEPPPPSLKEYIQELESFAKKAVEARGMTIQVSVVPNLRLYAIAKDLETAARNGWSDDKTNAHLKKQSRKYDKLDQRMKVFLHLENQGSKDHLFLRKKTKSHVKVRGAARVKEVTEGAPKPRFHKWQIIQGASLKKFTLARFEELKFTVTVEKKSNELTTIELRDLMHYFEAPRRNEYETVGIHLGARQISLGDIKTMFLEPIAIELAPATWEEPRLPEKLKKALATLSTK